MLRDTLLANVARLGLGAAAMIAAAPVALANGKPVFTTAPSQLQFSGAPLGELSARPAKAVAPAPKQAAPVAPQTEAGVRRAAEAVLRRLPNGAQGYRVQGENGMLEWPIYLTKAQAAGSVRLQIAYQSSASVMPEASSLVASVNDAQVGNIAIGGARDFRTLRLDIPAGSLQPGYNSVRVAVNQRHRVDCSLEATFELWTQVDPFSSGLIVSTGEVRGLDELPAAALDPLGGLSVRVHAPANFDRTRLARATQALALATGVKQVRVLEDNANAFGDAVELHLGTINEIEAPVRKAIGGIFGPAVLVAPGEGPLSLVVTGRNDAEIDAALEHLANAHSKVGAPQGVRAHLAFHGANVTGGERVQFSAHGVASQKFNGRMFRAGVNIRLPADFYPADNGKAVLHFVGGYAPELSRASQIVLSVNGQKATSVRLGASGGEVFTDNAVPVPLSQFRPGLNRFEIEAQVPAPEDAQCHAPTMINASSRFLLFNSTELEFPKLARATTAPEIGATMAGGAPGRGDGAALRIVAPAGDKVVEAVAHTIAARLGAEADRVIDIEFVEADTGDRSLPTIVLGGMRDLREEDTRRVDLQNILKASAKKDAGQDLRGLNWRGRVLAQDTPLACQSLTPGDGAPLLARRRKQNFDMNPVGSILGGSASNPNADLLRDWRDHVNARSIFQRAGESLTRVGTSLRDTAASLNPLKSESRDDMLGPRATLDGERFVMAQSAPTRSDAPVTVIAAANRADLRNAVDCLTDARVWSQARGRSASIDPTSGAVMSRAADDKSIVSIYPLTFENLRLVVATWLSLHMKSYVAATMAAAGLLAWATARLLERTRRSA